MSIENAKGFLRKRPGYLKKNPQIIANLVGTTYDNAKQARKEVLEERKNQPKVEKKKTKVKKRRLPKPFLGGDPENILIIGDLHEPFCLKGYLEHCRNVQEQENCGTVIFIGDVIDNHYSSYHETDPDGYSAGEELDRAIDKIAEWYKVFPEAVVVIGNHDRMAYRKAQTAGVSKKWVREYHEVLETPNWEFVEFIEIKDVNYNHGEGGTARTKMRKEIQSQVQGHLHSDFYVEYAVGPRDRIFGMQVGCGVDRHAYAMAYGRNFKKPIIGCGTVKKGIFPQLHPMEI